MMAETTAPPASIVSSQDPDRHPGHDRQRAIRADHEAEQIGPWRVDERAAQMHEFAAGQHRLDAEHVVHGEPVFQAVGAAGIFGDVAADRADLLA